MDEFRGWRSISMNNKRMDKSDVSASVASPADYVPYTAHLPPDTPGAESI